jgi:hypothetical protein
MIVKLRNSEVSGWDLVQYQQFRMCIYQEVNQGHQEDKMFL